MNVIGILTALTLSTRFYNLSVPTYVCWDETHFGRMAGQYLNGTYFVDVHPPLGKILIALAGHLTGYDGRFGFASPGDEYTKDGENLTKYYGMRALSAILGSLVVPLAFGTVESMTGSKEAGLLTSVLLIFDTGLITLCQYILLDPILIFFMIASIFFTVKCSSFPYLTHRSSFHELQCNKSLGCEKSRTMGRCSAQVEEDLGNVNATNVKKVETESFSMAWWLCLLMSGVCLGCVFAVKWNGLFTILFIGFWTVNRLWNLLGDIEGISMKDFIKHFIARALCLIIVPICIYCSSFALHYGVLDKSGIMDGHHSSIFQSCLKGSELYNASMPLRIAYGSVITLKYHHISTSGYLHSHKKLYPIELVPFPYQQVTLYFHKDKNNYWEILKPSELEIASTKSSDGEKQYNEENRILKSGDVIRLKHLLTGHNLHSNAQAAPMTPRHQIVSGYNYSTHEERNNELWKIEIVKTKDNGYNRGIQVLSTLLRLVHVGTGCVLSASSKMLPRWGDNQFEVTCSHHRRDRDYAVWNIEHHSNERLPKSKIKTCGMTFLQKIVESHLVMASINSGLKPEEGERTSKPWHWPLNYKGQPFSRMGENDLRVYLLGNPLIFWLNLVATILFSFLAVILRILKLRGYEISQNCRPASGPPYGKSIPTEENAWKKVALERHIDTCTWFLLAWALHYFPFYFMSRILYFHHYYPAFILNCCLTGSFLDLLFKSSSVCLSRWFEGGVISTSGFNKIIHFLFVFCILQSFYLYCPLCYGMSGSYSYQKGSVMYGLKYFSHWEI